MYCDIFLKTQQAASDFRAPRKLRQRSNFDDITKRKKQKKNPFLSGELRLADERASRRRNFRNIAPCLESASISCTRKKSWDFLFFLSFLHFAYLFLLPPFYREKIKRETNFEIKKKRECTTCCISWRFSRSFRRHCAHSLLRLLGDTHTIFAISQLEKRKREQKQKLKNIK